MSSAAAGASKAAPYLVSRRALKRLTQKYPQYLKETISNSKPKEEAPWPRNMRIAGYTAVALAIPYSFIATVAESPRLKEYLEGDPVLEGTGTNTDDATVASVTIGQKIVDVARWYWGNKDHIPYSEYLEDMDHGEASLPGENVSTIDRKSEAGVQSRIREDVRIRVDMDGDDAVEHVGMVPGNILLSNMDAIRKGVGVSNPNGDISLSELSIEDSDTDSARASLDQSDGGETTTVNFQNSDTTTITTMGEDNLSVSFDSDVAAEKNKDASRFAIWSAWHAFPTVDASSGASKTAGSSSTSMSMDQIEVEELKYKIEKLQKDMRDPMCRRDIDDMNTELVELKKRMRAKWRVRSVDKLKKIFGKQ